METAEVIIGTIATLIIISILGYSIYKIWKLEDPVFQEEPTHEEQE